MKKFDEFLEINSKKLVYLFSLMQYEGIPIVFVCKDENSLYICLCTEIRKIQTWIVGPVSLENIETLISQQIDLYHVFKDIEYPLYQIESKRYRVFTSKTVHFKAINELDLPVAGEMLGYMPNEAYEGLLELKTESINKAYLKKCTHFHEMLIGALSRVQDDDNNHCFEVKYKTDDNMVDKHTIQYLDAAVVEYISEHSSFTRIGELQKDATKPTINCGASDDDLKYAA